MTNPKQNMTLLRDAYPVGGKAIMPTTGSVIASYFAASSSPREGLEQGLATVSEYSLSTVEEIAALAHLDNREGTTLLEDLGFPLGLGPKLLRDFRRAPNGASELQDWLRYDQLDYTLGCEPDASAPHVVSGAADTADSIKGPRIPSALHPASVSLIDPFMATIYDQGLRGTCVAFSAVACLEYHIRRFGGQAGIDLSEQFVYWNMQTKTGHRNLASCLPLLQLDGACLEHTWPYYPKEIPNNEGQGPPPTNAAVSALAFRPTQTVRLGARSVTDLQGAIKLNRVVAVAFPVYTSWYKSPVVRKYGNITMPLPGEIPHQMGHAVALVGFEDHADFAGGGYFIVRNSWGGYWASSSVFGPGYGTLPYSYISGHNWDAWCVF